MPTITKKQLEEYEQLRCDRDNGRLAGVFAVVILRDVHPLLGGLEIDTVGLLTIFFDCHNSLLLWLAYLRASAGVKKETLRLTHRVYPIVRKVGCHGS